LLYVNERASPIFITLLGRHISVGIASTLLMSYVKEGRLNALAVSVPNRLSSAPESPTVAEAAGMPGYDMQTWFVLAGPAGMPAAIVDRLQREAGKALAQPEMRTRITDLGIEPANDPSPQKAAEIMRTYQVRMRKLIEAAGISLGDRRRCIVKRVSACA
jgi:tripartite-type tricarboxylate transporter receptor subunit TctC